MSEETGLVAIPKGGALELFTGKDGIELILEGIRAKVAELKPDTSTAKGRKEIASMAHKVSKSKVVLDGLGKDLVADWKEKAKAVDSQRKTARDELDALRDTVRKPLTEWEDAEEKRIKDEALAAEELEAWNSALAEDDIFKRERELRLKEEAQELIRLEAERVAEVSRIEAERVANEERIRQEASKKAEQEAAAAIQAEKDKTAKAEIDKIAAEQRALLEKEQAEERRIAAELQVETDRIAAEQKAEQDRLDAIQRTKDDAEETARQKEADRLRDEKEKQAEDDLRAADKAHRRKVNQEALKGFTDHGIDEMVAKGIIEIIAKGKIPHVSINY